MTEPDLKPCPFCGGEASAISPDEVGCFNGECPSEPHVWAETEAIAAWNTRAIDPATDRIEQLQYNLKTSEEIGRAFEEDAGQLRAKLSKAIAALDEAIYLLHPDEEDIAKGAGLYRIVTTYKELKEN
jgi:hypothetical protein